MSQQNNKLTEEELEILEQLLDKVVEEEKRIDSIFTYSREVFVIPFTI